ncbi:hypothetical protein DFJ73DRAFT_758244 [Zopfochytrium polystomum]|nr:hypothetical protein DFJ73DRAFT_758244 [Zopfochytrium polystomum]
MHRWGPCAAIHGFLLCSVSAAGAGQRSDRPFSADSRGAATEPTRKVGEREHVEAPGKVVGCDAVIQVIKLASHSWDEIVLDDLLKGLVGARFNQLLLDATLAVRL